MSIKNSVLPNFVRSSLFIALAGFSLTSFAVHHEEGEEKAAAKVEDTMQKKDASMKKESSDYTDSKHEGMESDEMNEAKEALKEEAESVAPEQ